MSATEKIERERTARNQRIAAYGDGVNSRRTEGQPTWKGGRRFKVIGAEESRHGDQKHERLCCPRELPSLAARQLTIHSDSPVTVSHLHQC